MKQSTYSFIILGFVLSACGYSNSENEQFCACVENTMEMYELSVHNIYDETDPVSIAAMAFGSVEESEKCQKIYEDRGLTEGGLPEIAKDCECIDELKKAQKLYVNNITSTE